MALRYSSCFCSNSWFWIELFFNIFYWAFNFSLIVLFYIPIWYKLSFSLFLSAISKRELSNDHMRRVFAFARRIQLPLKEAQYKIAELIAFLQFFKDISRHLLRVLSLSLIWKAVTPSFEEVFIGLIQWTISARMSTEYLCPVCSG